MFYFFRRQFDACLSVVSIQLLCRLCNTLVTLACTRTKREPTLREMPLHLAHSHTRFVLSILMIGKCGKYHMLFGSFSFEGTLQGYPFLTQTWKVASQSSAISSSFFKFLSVLLRRDSARIGLVSGSSVFSSFWGNGYAISALTFSYLSTSLPVSSVPDFLISPNHLSTSQQDSLSSFYRFFYKQSTSDRRSRSRGFVSVRLTNAAPPKWS